ncbi:MAG: amidohydrolase family protein [bacterium]|nr:amidohydrolase family protein [bacterium]
MNQQNNSYSPMQCDLAIINARIITGDCSPAFDGMVGVSKGRICYVGTVQPYSCDTVIDAQGKILSPGFIDIHGHSDFTILLYPDAESKVAQGVTTEFIGNCGLSAAPLYGDAWKRWHSRW